MARPKIPDKKWGDLQQVEQWYSKEKDVHLKERLNAIRLLMLGKSQKSVAEAIGVCPATIRNYRSLWDLGGKENLKANFKGRISKVTPQMKAEIEQIIEVKKEINGKTVTGKLIVGYLKKNSD